MEPSPSKPSNDEATRAAPGEATVPISDGSPLPPRDQAPSSSMPGLPELSIGPSGSPSATPAAPEPPKIEGYVVHAPIGQGGMGTVWRGVQLSTRRNVALKLISSAGFASERARGRFDREVEITARLEHPHIARIYDSGIHRGVYFYAMELIDGLPLDIYVERASLSREQVLRLFVLICRAVHHAHARGVIHRDLKPGNILVSPDCQPHVLDFGLAKALLQVGMEAGISVDGEVAGTPGYMAPEQAAGKSDLDSRCDVYSLGVILYRMLTGQTPHDMGGTYIDVLRRVSEEEPRRPRTIDRTLPRELETILLHALQRDPARRYKSAADLADDVERYLNGDPILARRPTAIYRVRKRMVKHRVALVVASVVIVLATAVTAITIARRRDARAHAIFQACATVESGDAFLSQGKFGLANGAYYEGLHQLIRLGQSPLPAELGYWDLSRLWPQPLSVAPRIGIAPNHPPQISAGPPRFESDSRHVLVGYDDGKLRLWDMAAATLQRTIIVGEQPIRSVAVSADGRLALSGGENGDAAIWNLADGKSIGALKDPASPLSGWVTQLAISPDGHFAISASGATPESLASPAFNDTLTLWNLATRQPLLRTNRSAGVLDAKASLVHLSFSPDSKLILGAGGDVAAWRVADGKRAATLDGSATAAAFSRDGSAIVAGGSDGTVRLLDLGTSVPLVFEGGGPAIAAIAYDDAGRRVLAGTENGAFLAVSKSGRRTLLEPRDEVNYVAISPDGAIGLTTDDERLLAWRMSASPVLREVAAAGSFADVCVSGDGLIAIARSRRLAAGPGLSDIAIYDVPTGHLLTPAGFPMGRCNGAALSLDGRTAAHLSGATLSTWSLDPPHEVDRRTIKPAPSSLESTPIAISANGALVAVASTDNAILLYRVGQSSEPARLEGHTAAVTSLRFSEDGRWLLSGSEDRTARFWDATAGKQIALLQGHGASVNCVAMTQDATMAVTGAGGVSGEIDNSVRLWELPSGKPLATLQPGHQARVRAVAISGDGELLASSADDGQVILWEPRAAKPYRTVAAPRGAITSMSMSPDRQVLLCGGESLLDFDFGFSQRERPLQIAVAAMRTTPLSNPLDAGVLLTRARWYSLEMSPAWAKMLFDESRGAGPAPSMLELARCDWMRGDLASAEREFASVTPPLAPAFYVKLCLDAIRSQPAGK